MSGMTTTRPLAMVASVAAVVAVGAGAALAAVGPADTRTAGPRPDGTSVLPTGWTVTPAGSQHQLGEKPFGTALSPDGRTLLVSNDGDGTESLQAVDAATGEGPACTGSASPAKAPATPCSASAQHNPHDQSRR